MNDDLKELTVAIIPHLTEILSEFGIKYTRYPDRISFTCPIHGSDNYESLSVFTTGDIIGNWQCWTKHCEQELVKDTVNGKTVERPRGNGIFGLIRGLLSCQLGRHVEYKQAIFWVKNRLGLTTYQPIKIDPERESIDSFVQMTTLLNRERRLIETHIDRNQIRASLNMPAQYFIGRGFSRNILDRYDVGFCERYGTQMYNRVVVPVYDDDYKFMVGCLGRTIYPKCVRCLSYHDISKPCPSQDMLHWFKRKWKNSKGFNTDSYLYNYWFAKNRILETGVAILVEGTSDVWRLEEAGITVGLGLFGDSLSVRQKQLLDMSGAMNVIIATDNDDAGRIAKEKITKQCEAYYNCHFVELPLTKDVGDMPVEQTQAVFNKVLARFL